MRPTFRLGTIAGVPVGVHWTLLLVGGLLVLSLGGTSLPATHPGYSSLAYWLVAAAAAVLFFGSVLAHELAHAVVAHRNGVGVHGITLWLLGGEARLAGEPPSARAELAIAAVGPLSSLVLAAGFALAALGSDALGLAGPTGSVLAWLALVNGVLAVFNLLPGAPLDGGRVLAALVWWWRRDRTAGALLAAQVGRLTGAAVVVAGVALALVGGPAGLWTALVGWFLVGASGAEAAYWRERRALAGRTLGSVMSPVAHAPDWSRVADVEARLTPGVAVVLLDGADGQPRSAVTRAAVDAVPADQRPWLGAMQVAVPLGRVLRVSRHEPADAALAQAAGHDDAPPFLLVVDGESVVGVVTDADVRRAATVAAP